MGINSTVNEVLLKITIASRVLLAEVGIAMICKADTFVNVDDCVNLEHCGSSIWQSSTSGLLYSLSYEDI